MTTPTLLRKFRDWTREADYGDVFVYGFGSTGMRSPEAFEHARKISDAGLAFLYQRRNESGTFDHVAKRTSVQSHLILDKVSESVRAPARKDRGRGHGRPRKED